MGRRRNQKWRANGENGRSATLAVAGAESVEGTGAADVEAEGAADEVDDVHDSFQDTVIGGFNAAGTDPGAADKASPQSRSTSSAKDESAGESGGVQIAALTAELGDKEELIAALTAQLEEAAERLDRLHRAGADRSPRAAAAGSAESSERQSELAGQVSRLVDEWDELHAAEWLQRIEVKLGEINESLARGSISAIPRDLSPSRESMPPRETPAARDSSSLRGTLLDSWVDVSMPSGPTPQESLLHWEQMKAQLLGDSQVIENVSDEPPRAAALAPVQGAAEYLEAMEAIEPPLPVDFEQADLETLQHAVEERDTYISHLICKLRATQGYRHEPIDWEALNAAPEELRAHLEELEERLRELLRVEECDLSLERARLARERARLEQMRRVIEGGGAAAAGDSRDEEQARVERRWLRMFGFGGKPAEPDDGCDE